MVSSNDGSTNQILADTGINQVGSALPLESPSCAQSADFYVEIKWAGKKDGHRTRTQSTQTWNEEFPMYVESSLRPDSSDEAGPNSIGNALSIISLEIKQSSAEVNIPAPKSSIGWVQIPLGTLLKVCTGDEGMSTKR